MRVLASPANSKPPAGATQGGPGRVSHYFDVEDGRLVGIVTDRDLKAATPQTATTLSVYELNYLLSKLEVREVMFQPARTAARLSSPPHPRGPVPAMGTDATSRRRGPRAGVVAPRSMRWRQRHSSRY